MKNNEDKFYETLSETSIFETIRDFEEYATTQIISFDIKYGHTIFYIKFGALVINDIGIDTREYLNLSFKILDCQTTYAIVKLQATSVSLHILYIDMYFNITNNNVTKATVTKIAKQDAQIEDLKMIETVIYKHDI